MRSAAAIALPLEPYPLPPPEGTAGRHLVDVTLLFTPTSGGVRRYLLAKHDWLLSRTRLKHTILVPGTRTAGRNGDVVSVASAPIPLGGGYRVPLGMRAFRERLEQLEPDLLEVGDPYHLAWQSIRVARERAIPAIAFCHSDVVRLATSVGGAGAGRVASRYLARLYARFDRVLAPSAAVAGQLRAAGIRDVEIQPLGVDVATMTPSRADASLRRSLGIPPRAKLLVFAGRMSREKRPQDLIAAAGLLGRDCHLLLVGCRRTSALGPNVTGLVYQQDGRRLASILASCDAFVHAGDQETFGLVVLEAMACGLPVVTARAGALTELVDVTVGETFRPRDPADLARAVRRLFERDCAAIGRTARRRAERFSWQAVFTRLLSLYGELMPSGANRAQRGPLAR